MGGSLGAIGAHRRTEQAAAEVGATGQRAAARTWTWIYDARHDLVMALAWVPIFAVVAVVLRVEGLGEGQLAAIVAATLFASALHQPLTLGLVYGDPDRRAAHAALFRWAPVVVVAIVVGATLVVPLVVIPVAAAWNTVHTVQQRYGLGRIYARRSGYGSAGVDRALLYSSLVVAILAVATRSDLVRLVDQAGLQGRNARAVEGLSAFGDAAAWLLVPALAVFVGSLVLFVRVERQAGPRANLARWLYLGSSLGLVGALVVNPAAGFVAYVAAHSVEYVIVVHRAAVRSGAAPGAQGAVARTRGRPIVVAASMLAVMAPVAALHLGLTGRALSVGLACVGALHFLYDGVIWKLRRPAVAREFAIAST